MFYSLRSVGTLPDCTTDIFSGTNTCFWIESGSFEKSEAEDACEARGGFLAHIKNHATKMFLEQEELIG